MNRIVKTDCCDVMRNLAVEEILLNILEGEACLFLWQNDNTVVIGRNQNAWQECRVALLEDEGGCLARRKTGGGAVYHDLGNLNYSFIMSKRAYDVARQNDVLIRAVGSFGITAEQTGRNDIVLSGTGEKFSGNAFKVGEPACLHHGTLLIGADMEKLSRYLAPPAEKLRSKGIESVRSRVTNLQAHQSSITAKDMACALAEAFACEYGATVELPIAALDPAQIDKLAAFYNSWEWRFGSAPPFDVKLDNRFSWGCVELLLSIKSGCIAAAKLYTDSLETSLPEDVEPQLIGARCMGAAMRERLIASASTQAQALGEWLGGLSL